MILRTRRLLLRPLEEGDLPALVAALNDLEVARWLARVPHPYGFADGRAFLAHLATGAESAWVIDDGALAGLVGLDAGGIGYWVARAAWGRGYATEAARAVLAHHFADPAATAARSHHFEGNAASAGVLRKLGFEPTGPRAAWCLALEREVPGTDLRLSRARWDALSR